MNSPLERYVANGNTAVATRRRVGVAVAPVLVAGWSNTHPCVDPTSTNVIASPTFALAAFGMKHDAKRPEEAPSG